MKRKPLNIVHLCATSTVAGANRYAFDLASGQIDAGHNVSVIIPKHPAGSLMFCHKGTPVVMMGAPRMLTSLRAITSLRPDIIHCHGARASQWLRFLPRKTPILSTLHQKYKHKYMSKCNGIHAIAKEQNDEIDRSGYTGTRLTYPNWLTKLSPSSETQIAQARQMSGANYNDFLVGYLGNLAQVKGVDNLLHAFKSLDKTGLRLVVIGEGNEKESLNKIANNDDRIRFMPATSRPQDWYQAVDLLVIPSRSESFGLVAVEAMSVGAPLITSQLPCFYDKLATRKDCIVNTSNLEELGQAILQKARLKTTEKIMRDSYDVSDYDRDAGILAVTDFYDNVIAHANL